MREKNRERERGKRMNKKKGKIFKLKNSIPSFFENQSIFLSLTINQF